MIKLRMRRYFFLLQVGDIIYPYLVKTPKVWDDWIDPPPNKNEGEPHFSEVDNSGRWNILYFQTKSEIGT